MNEHLLANAKAYAALVGSVCTGLLAVYAADSTLGQVLTVVAILCTALGTWAVPNTAPERDEEGSADVLLAVAILVCVVLLLFGVQYGR